VRGAAGLQQGSAFQPAVTRLNGLEKNKATVTKLELSVQCFTHAVGICCRNFIIVYGDGRPLNVTLLKNYIGQF